MDAPKTDGVADRFFDKGKQDGDEVVHDRVLTIPNLLSLIRLAMLPFVYNDLVNGEHLRALIVLGIFSTTDWFDGYIARRFDQVSRIGQIADPLSDRLLVIVVGIGMVRAELLPLWALLVLLARDVAVLVGGTWLLRGGGRPPPVTRVGKAATFILMFVLPTFILASVLGDGAADREPISLAIAWGGYAVGTALYYWAAWQYAQAVLTDRRAASLGGRPTEHETRG